MPPTEKLIELVMKELVVRIPVLTVLAKVDRPKSLSGFKYRDVPNSVLAFI